MYSSASPQPASPLSSIWPLTISADNRWVLQADGTPFNINGEAPWSIEVNITQTDVSTYLNDRATRGVNAILFQTQEHQFSDNSPVWKNENGDIPFTGTVSGVLDFTTPNEVYWANVDSVINKAAALGITCFLAPAYLGFSMGSEGWASVINTNGTSRMTTYGNFLGNRYKTFPNIVWVMGGDSGPTGTFNLTTHVNNLANAIKSADPNHLMTAHPSPTHSAYDDYNQSWLDINTAYADTVDIVHKEVRTSRQQVAKPTFLIESVYGNEHSSTTLDLRTEMYQATLGGAIGHLYGQSPMWYFGVNSSASGNSFADTGGLDWHNTLGSFGSDMLTYVSRLQASRPMNTLSPDYGHTVVTAGYDTGGVEGVTYCPVMASNKVLISYLRQGSSSPLTVNKAQFVSATFNVHWYNVRTGSTTSSGTASFGSGTQVFTAPDTNDWVLLLDDQSLGLTNP